MKAIVFVVIGGVAALLGWLFFQPECFQGVVVASEHACVQVPGFDRQFCERAFARPEEAIFRAGSFYQTRDDCLRRHTDCIEFPGVHGYTPKPTGYCVLRGADGSLAGMKPVYGRPS
ncbi:MAG TPA: hypothetical protein PLQ11_02780 [Beijerinckiaceae bacterium]|nr:hypothetical protein [Beijerinckiaceae bacterium]